MDLQELRQKTIKELDKELKTKYKDLEGVMGDLLQRKEKNLKKAGGIRKNIARIKTLINEKKILESLNNDK